MNLNHVSMYLLPNFNLSLMKSCQSATFPGVDFVFQIWEVLILLLKIKQLLTESRSRWISIIFNFSRHFFLLKTFIWNQPLWTSSKWLANGSVFGCMKIYINLSTLTLILFLIVIHVLAKCKNNLKYLVLHP